MTKARRFILISSAGQNVSKKIGLVHALEELTRQRVAYEPNKVTGRRVDGRCKIFLALVSFFITTSAS